MIETRAPGKLFIAGEYAVVEPGEPAILVAVDRYLSVRVSASENSSGCIHSTAYGDQPRVWARDDAGDRIVLEHAPVDFVAAAIDAVEELRAARGIEPRYFDLHIGSELDDPSGRKFGLGSSGAVTVAVISALEQFYGLGLTRLERFRLGLLTTIELSPRASGGDIAASTYGGWIRYTSPDREALRAHRTAHGLPATMTAPLWDICTITPLPAPRTLELMVGWTGSPASTERLVDGVQRSEQDHERQRALFRAGSRENVEVIVAALGADETPVQPAIRRVRRLLQELDASTGIRIETDRLRAMCDIVERHGAVAKPSGAGGGDCGIALVEPGTAQALIAEDWVAHGIQHLALTVHDPEEDGDGR
ncbi:phosphomevalonate kinase [uncultured Microbacterium sp.]|uniref:phosphomevalonate kinase n=1 Tax=uncultured Microbacterium sp. TaxID=191216 RepID=UPI002612ADF3|nr:phosphomevalonate kinase [uncultured Microbacterium sp.]